MTVHIVVLAGGVGGARFLRGVREEARRRYPDGEGGSTARITAIVNTGDDAWLAGLRITPDLDSILYTLAGVNDEVRGWGRVGETERVSAELREYNVGWPWFTLGDLDLGTHIARTSWLREGIPLSAAVQRLSQRWPIGVELLPMTDDEVETHVEVADDSGDADGDADTGASAEVGEDGTHLLHFQEWWTRFRAAKPALRFVPQGVEASTPAPGVLEAIRSADAILVAPSNPVVSIGTILAVPGLREQLAAADAHIVGVSPIIAGAVVRGMADACLSAIGVQTSAYAVARHYGARSEGGLLDGWVVDDADLASAGELSAIGLPTEALPLLMRDADSSAAIAGAALDLSLGRRL